MSVDIEKYREHIAHFDMTDEEKIAFLNDLWSIMESFVDEAWGFSPHQTAANDNEENSRSKALKMMDHPPAANNNEPTPQPVPEAKERMR